MQWRKQQRETTKSILICVLSFAILVIIPSLLGSSLNAILSSEQRKAYKKLLGAIQDIIG